MMYKISVPDMHCEKCVERIEKALTECKIDFTVELENRLVTVNGCEHCLNQALASLDDLGFTPQVIKE